METRLRIGPSSTSDAARKQPVVGRVAHPGRTQSFGARVFVILVAVTMTLLSSLLVLTLRSPTYRSTAEVLVTPIPSDDTITLGLPLIRQAGDPIRTIETATAVLDSREIARVAADRLGKGWSAERVSAIVNVAPMGQANIITISAQASDATTARQVANAYVTAAVNVRNAEVTHAAVTVIRSIQEQIASAKQGQSLAGAALEQRLAALQVIQKNGDPTVSIAQGASVPSAPQGPAAWLVLILAAGAGAAIGVAVIFASDRMHARHQMSAISTPEHLREEGLRR